VIEISVSQALFKQMLQDGNACSLLFDLGTRSHRESLR